MRFALRGRRPATLAAALLAGALFCGATGHAFAQVPLDEPLDEHAAKRLDRLEKAVKELRAIVFQGRETGAPRGSACSATDRETGVWRLRVCCRY